MLYLSAYVGIWLLLQPSALKSADILLDLYLSISPLIFDAIVTDTILSFLLQLVCRSTVDFCMFIPFATV